MEGTRPAAKLDRVNSKAPAILKPGPARESGAGRGAAPSRYAELTLATPGRQVEGIVMTARTPQIVSELARRQPGLVPQTDSAGNLASTPAGAACTALMIAGRRRRLCCAPITAPGFTPSRRPGAIGPGQRATGW
jgi:hypothetical protein